MGCGCGGGESFYNKVVLRTTVTPDNVTPVCHRSPPSSRTLRARPRGGVERRPTNLFKLDTDAIKKMLDTKYLPFIVLYLTTLYLFVNSDCGKSIAGFNRSKPAVCHMLMAAELDCQIDDRHQVMLLNIHVYHSLKFLRGFNATPNTHHVLHGTRFNAIPNTHNVLHGTRQYHHS